MIDVVRLLGWLLGLAGGAGLIGLLVLAVLAPAIAGALVRGGIAIAGGILRTPLGAALAAGVICGTAGLVYGDHYGRAIERARCEAAQLAAEAAAVRRDKLQDRLADTDATSRIAALEQQQAQDQETLRAYQQALQARPGDDCTLGPDDLPRGLRPPGRP